MVYGSSAIAAILSILIINLFIYSIDIEYGFTETDYSISEGVTAEVCVTILPGSVTFTPGGFLTLSFHTSPITANCRLNHKVQHYIIVTFFYSQIVVMITAKPLVQ